MSHVTEVKMKLKDLDAVDEAAKLCGLELVRGKTTYKWYGRFMNDTTPPTGRDPKDYGKNAEHVLRQIDNPGGYEIGLVPALDGNGYDAMFDSWSSAGGRLPVMAAQLKREYSAVVATKKAAPLARKGFKVFREDLGGNRIRLRLRKR